MPYIRDLENCIQFGTPVLLENVEESLDAILDPVLQKATFKQGTLTMATRSSLCNEAKIMRCAWAIPPSSGPRSSSDSALFHGPQVLHTARLEPIFRLYITTKLPNPHFPPEICVAVSILNFMATQESGSFWMLRRPMLSKAISCPNTLQRTSKSNGNNQNRRFQ